MESKNELIKIDFKNCACYYFHDITKIEDFGFGNILLDQNSYENILVHDIFKKLLLEQNHSGLDSIK